MERTGQGNEQDMNKGKETKTNVGYEKEITHQNVREEVTLGMPLPKNEHGKGKCRLRVPRNQQNVQELMKRKGTGKGRGSGRVEMQVKEEKGKETSRMGTKERQRKDWQGEVAIPINTLSRPGSCQRLFAGILFMADSNIPATSPSIVAF